MTDLQPQVWFGILLRPAESATPEQPALPGWAAGMLDNGTDADGMDAELAARRYTGDSLRWIRYAAPGSPGLLDYYGLAVAASVQTHTGHGRVSACYPDDVLDGWAASLAQACHILQIPSGADMTWYQSAAWQL